MGFSLIMLGFLLQWPTLLTLLMFPILVVMYARLARYEEREALAEFGDEYAQYAARAPAFFPHLGQRSSHAQVTMDSQGADTTAWERS
jgi:protein-S-isoprenylcysteine O-methyltransferase Ste14